MALNPEAIGKCYCKIKGKVCGGKIVERRISPNKDVMIVGRGQPAGYICTKCKYRYGLPPPNSAELKKLRKLVISTIKNLDKKSKAR